MEALYQSVWAQVFAATWADLREAANIGKINPAMQSIMASSEADKAADAALRSWSHSKAHAAVTAKGQES